MSKARNRYRIELERTMRENNIMPGHHTLFVDKRKTLTRIKLCGAKPFTPKQQKVMLKHLTNEFPQLTIKFGTTVKNTRMHFSSFQGATVHFIHKK